jgi:hypothetical protein
MLLAKSLDFDENDHSSPHEILTNVATNIVETKPGKQELIQKHRLRYYLAVNNEHKT